MAYHDGSPVVDKVNKVKVSYGENWEEKNYTSQELSLDNGLATLILTLPDNISGVSMNVSKNYTENVSNYFHQMHKYYV